MNFTDVVVSLSEPQASGPEFGGKGSTLATLLQAGFAVPSGVVISSRLYLDELERLTSDGELTTEMILASVVPRLRPASELVKAVERRLLIDESALDRFVVRSSAVGEDSALASFAGQLESVVDVGLDDLGPAITEVWRSAWSARAVDYRRRLGLARAGDLPVAVVVQRLVEPDRAGVLFTRSPMSGETESIVEVVLGRGGQLVDGSVAPSRYVVAEHTIVQDLDSGVTLPDEILRELYALGRDLEGVLGAGLDVEWVEAHGELYLVQARPITSDAGPLADPAEFSAHAVAIDVAHRSEIPEELAGKDKFKLRLISTRNDAPISRGWLVEVRRNDTGLSWDRLAEQVRAAAHGEDQFSTVLQRPAKLDGEIVRQFSSDAFLGESLRKLVSRVGSAFDSFDLIITEVYRAEKSGIARIDEDRLYVEIAFGAYVPKGIVPTSIYVYSAAGELDASTVVRQESGVFIEEGTPVSRDVGAVARLEPDQVGQLRHMTVLVDAAYGGVSVEFGVRPSGEIYLIDVIKDDAAGLGDDARVMSRGSVTGSVVFADTEDLLERSLEAHFHSDRGSGDGSAESLIVVAPRPFLALEQYLEGRSTGGLGFVFESGSLLGHLAIILREHGVPAIVVRDIRDHVSEGDELKIDTSGENLFEIVKQSG